MVDAIFAMTVFMVHILVWSTRVLWKYSSHKEKQKQKKNKAKIPKENENTYV